MARACTICNHPERESIEQDAASQNGSLRSISARYGITPQSLKRHITNHLPEKIAQSAAAQSVAESDRLVDTIVDLQKRSREIYNLSINNKKPRDALQAIREERETVKLLAQVQGEMPSEHPPITINLNIESEVKKIAHLLPDVKL